MRCFVLALALLATAATVACAQDAIPDLKGTWTGKGKSIVFGTNPHHPDRKPRPTRRACVTSRRHTWSTPDSRLAWGHSASTAANTEPFAWAIASDNRTIMGADLDGCFRITLVSPDRMEKCYTQNAISPSQAIVATCHMMDRVKR
jgi:hypothetical protein